MNNGVKMTENIADNDGAYILLKWGLIIKWYEG